MLTLMPGGFSLRATMRAIQRHSVSRLDIGFRSTTAEQSTDDRYTYVSNDCYSEQNNHNPCYSNCHGTIPFAGLVGY